MKSPKTKKRSLNHAFRMFSVLLIALLAIELVFVVSTSYSLFDQYRLIGIRSMLQVYSQSIDSQLRNVNNYMNTLVGNSDVQLMQVSTNARTRFMARNEVSDHLSTLLQMEPMINGALCWSGDETVAVNGARDMNINEKIKEAIFRFASEEKMSMVNTGWKWTQIEGNWYLVSIRSYQSAYVAVWFNTAFANAYTQSNDFNESYRLLCRQEGVDIGAPPMETEQAPGWSERNMLVQPSEEGNFEYLCISLESKGTAFHFLITILVCCFVIAVTVLVAISLLRHLVKETFTEIHKGLVIKGENLSYALTNTGRIIETDDVFKTLDEMSKRILSLQNDVYFHALNEKNARLQALHMQINSHFFTNCMNIIFSLAEVCNTRLIQDFCIYLNDYFHYINTAFKSSSDLSDEMKHLQNYLVIQQMRYGRVQWEIDVEEKVKHSTILPLILLTFIENIFKHGMNEQAIHIQIHADEKKMGELNGLHIRIEDDGVGISQEVAQALNAFDFSKSPDFDNKSGIEKTLARIQIYYGKDAGFHIGRNERNRGTVVELFLPQTEN